MVKMEGCGISATRAIFIKELRIEFRNKQMINSMLILALMILASFRFIFSFIDFSETELAAPILWVTFFFSGMFALAPIYQREVEQGTRECLMLAPISASSIFFGKFLSSFLVILGLNLVSTMLFFVFFGQPFPDMVSLMTIIVLGTVGFTALGNLISAISANISQSQVMLPVLLIPILLFTVVMTSVEATFQIFDGATLVDLADGIKLILAFDIIFVASGYLLMDYLMEE